MRFRWRRRFGLASRIVIVIVLSQVSIELFQGMLTRLVPPPSFILIDQGWLSERTVEAVRAARATPAEEQQQKLDSLASSRWLSFRIESRPATETPAIVHGGADTMFSLTRRHVSVPMPGRPSQLLTSVARSIAQQLGVDPADIRASAETTSTDIDLETGTLVVLAASLPTRLVNVARNRMQSDIAILRSFRIAIGLGGSRWLVVSQNLDEKGTTRRFRNIAIILVSLLFIGSLSLWVARRLVRPLTRLSEAAERLGREREPTLIAEIAIPEYAAIARTFNEMQLRLKQFVDERTHMLAAIAHDLRTPLTRLRLFAEYVGDKAQQRQLLSDVAEMEAMINSTLAFASGEAKSEPHSRVDMAALLISLCDNACDAGGWVDYHGPDHAPLPCQPVAMRRALANLIENGCKYAGHVTVALSDDVDAVVIAISDDGPGIAPEQVERAFAPFQRLEGSRNRTTGGTGLGLAIARDVVHGHGGKIRLLPVVPHGLLVRVDLPKPSTPQV
ncbi:ATP-binding protein [Rhodanobacter glycinis]|uniref:histidine kinase n=1 Tax=Rhodanobacter glycinis TaxID=582702 RepID=A0A1I4ARP9_9GAMM|nr:ATP-binding protein [Rhodanobacter glycinis]SFK58637.1 Signal transduction histidine kinase [Rhodanobacter glycinis]